MVAEISARTGRAKQLRNNNHVAFGIIGLLAAHDLYRPYLPVSFSVNGRIQKNSIFWVNLVTDKHMRDASS